MALVSSCREILGYVPHRAHPLYCVAPPQREDSQETDVVNTEEGGDAVKSSRPLCPGLQTLYNGEYRRLQDRGVEASPKHHTSSDRGLQYAHGKLESVVVANQQAVVNTFPGLVHTARHATKVNCNRST